MVTLVNGIVFLINLALTAMWVHEEEWPAAVWAGGLALMFALLTAKSWPVDN